MQSPTTTYRVEVLDGGAWYPCVREDLVEELPTADLPPAEFPTAAAAEAFVETMRGLMHCGGPGVEFRVIPVEV
jgi:hypothetical protein